MSVPFDRQAQRPRALVVDDNPHMTKLLRLFLQKEYEVATAHDDASAMEQARQQDFDVVLLDINLGTERTGVDVMNSLRQLEYYTRVPMVAVTANAANKDRNRLLEAGFNGYVAKPFTKKDLLTCLDEVLAKDDKVVPSGKGQNNRPPARPSNFSAVA